MSLAATLWSAADVARHLGFSRATFYTKRPELERHGFPRPVPGTNHWQPVAIVLWEIERTTGRRVDTVDVLEAAGIGADPTRLLEKRAAALLR